VEKHRPTGMIVWTAKIAPSKVGWCPGVDWGEVTFCRPIVSQNGTDFSRATRRRWDQSSGPEGSVDISDEQLSHKIGSQNRKFAYNPDFIQIKKWNWRPFRSECRKWESIRSPVSNSRIHSIVQIFRSDDEWRVKWLAKASEQISIR
jgi:hypothetical protein